MSALCWLHFFFFFLLLLWHCHWARVKTDPELFTARASGNDIAPVSDCQSADRERVVGEWNETDSTRTRTAFSTQWAESRFTSFWRGQTFAVVVAVVYHIHTTGNCVKNTGKYLDSKHREWVKRALSATAKQRSTRQTTRTALSSYVLLGHLPRTTSSRQAERTRESEY